MKNFASRRARAALVIGAGAAILSVAVSLMPHKPVQAQEGGGDSREQSRIRQGFAISPFPIDPDGRNAALVGLGSYYVNAVSECADCHTNFPQYVPGHNPFLGQPKQINLNNFLRGGHPFPAVDPTGVEHPITSRSLRPENGLPAGLTFEQFEDVIRNGTDYDHPGRLLQVMPWPILQNMTDRDLLAIYTYLGTLPP